MGYSWLGSCTIGHRMMFPVLGRHVRTGVAVLGLLGIALTGTARAQVTVPGNYGTIQAAINAVLSGSLPNGTTINVQPGTYAEALIIGNTNRSLTLRGVGGSGATIVDAFGKNASALTIRSSTGQIVVRGLTFRRGSTSIEGGGFYIRDASPTLEDCVFESSSAFRGGGGSVWSSNATFTDCTIRNNSASNFGGGLYVVAGSRPVFLRCSITGNSSGNGGSGVGNNGVGGGVFSHDSSPTFRGSQINNNSSKFAAGGIFHQGIYDTTFGVATLTVEDSDVADNVASQSSGGDPPAAGCTSKVWRRRRSCASACCAIARTLAEG
jgi:parallel beta-helix repeat protein